MAGANAFRCRCCRSYSSVGWAAFDSSVASLIVIGLRVVRSRSVPCTSSNGTFSVAARRALPSAVVVARISTSRRWRCRRSWSSARSVTFGSSMHCRRAAAEVWATVGVCRLSLEWGTLPEALSCGSKPDVARWPPSPVIDGIVAAGVLVTCCRCRRSCSSVSWAYFTSSQTSLVVVGIRTLRSLSLP